MTKYAIYFFCNECGEVHQTGIFIGMPDGPVSKESIGNTYAGKELPPEIAIVRGNKTICPNTGKLTSQRDNDQIFIVPISN